MKRSEAGLIEDIYYTLCTKKFNDAAEVINYCCLWASRNAIGKVRYWLKYGLEHNGDYSAIPKINEALPDPYEKVPAEHLMYAFKLLDEAAKRRDFYRNE